MKYVLMLFLFILIFSSISKSQTIKVELKNVNNFVEIISDYNVNGISNDTSYTVKDTIITVSEKVIKDKKHEFRYPLHNITINCNIINYKDKILIKNIDNNYILLDLDSIQNEKRIIDEQKEIYRIAEKNDLISRASDVINEMVDKIEYYEKRLKGKSPLKAADMLYDEGFGRSYDMDNSNVYTIYGLRWTFDTGDYYSIKIKIWYSYGYGKSYYDIICNAYLNKYGFIINNNEETELGRSLREDN